MTEIEKTEGEIKVLQAKLELLKEMEKRRSPAEEAFKEVYGYYPEVCERSVWVAFQKGYEAAQKDYKVGEYEPKEKEQKWDVVRESVKWCKEHKNESVEDYLKPQTPEQVDAGLRNAMRKAKKDGVFDEPTKPMNEVLDRLENKYKDAEENAASYMTDEVVNRMLKKWETDPPSFLRFELGKTLEALITRWWDDVYDGIHQDWDREVAIDDLCDRVELWLPKSQSASGSQSLGVEDMVEGFNDCLTKIKSKLRNKK
jgi:hypothetical protein